MGVGGAWRDAYALVVVARVLTAMRI